ncbi:taste receptor type 2 member 9-like [Myiozetetes cayanensis]|uniref:taste receptor type 2 member 9-like n=1 Tax=Myiozetetes cayanensis TaxID=478635 RepID=UPI002160EF44|nr:taste receptor type 2 member 9-like [Myiozetetes cayanensis]
MEACHSPEQFSVTSYDSTALAIITFEAFAGMWINAFIVSVICMSWVRKKTLNSNEKILLLLASSRFCFLCVSWIHFFLSLIYPNYLHVHPIFLLSNSAQSILNCSNSWVSACLSVFYCIKIATFRNSFFIYLKAKIDRMVPWLLLWSVFFSLVIGTVVYKVADKAFCKNLNFTCQECIWKASIRLEELLISNYFILGFGYATPFTAVTISALLLLFSLWRHKRNMQTNSMKDLSMDAHIKAMKCILSFFIMYSINFVFFVLTMIYAKKRQIHLVFLFYVFQYAFPAFHSLIVIFSNPNLEKTLLKILSYMKCKFCMK